MCLKKGGKTYQEFPDLVFCGLRMNGFHFYYILFRVVIGGIEIVGHMELMTMGVLVHVVMLAKAIDQLKSLFLPGDGYSF